MRLIKPMLASQGTVTDLERKKYIFEPRLDGLRVIVYKSKNKVKIYNSTGKNLAKLFPEFDDVEKYIDAKSCVLDCEIVVYKKKVPNFDRLKCRLLLKKKVVKKSAKEHPAVLVAKDILMKDGKNLKNLSLIKRKEILENTVAETRFIEVVYYSEKGKQMWQTMLDKGIRGVVAKYKYSKYLPGKTCSNWLKIVF